NTIEEVINTKVQVNAAPNQDNTNKSVLDFMLPAGTSKWVYWIGTGVSSETTFENDRKKFADGKAKAGGATNPMAGLALGFSSLSNSTEGNPVHYYFISTGEETQKFSKAQAFKFFKQGESSLDFALMNYANKNPQKYYLALRNDNLTQNADVTVKIIAMIVASKYKALTEYVPTLLNHKVPVNED
ncbi:MAG: hypothetical protein ABUL41_00990, partial [Chitinophagaceae bacterium]